MSGGRENFVIFPSRLNDCFYAQCTEQFNNYTFQPPCFFLQPKPAPVLAAVNKPLTVPGRRIFTKTTTASDTASNTSTNSSPLSSSTINKNRYIRTHTCTSTSKKKLFLQLSDCWPFLVVTAMLPLSHQRVERRKTTRTRSSKMTRSRR